VLLRLTYLGLVNVFALLRLLPMSSRDKDAEILALRHQLLVLQRQLGPGRVRFTPADRSLLAALLHRLPRDVLESLHLVVCPDTVLRWHRAPASPSSPRTCGWSLTSTPTITTRTGHTGRCNKVRLPGVRIRPLWEQTSGFCAGTGSEA
jgi:hypothetical protein